VIGAPLAAGLLAMDGWLGIAGWQWLFIVEGVPTVLMGLYTKVNLAESPAKASFLTPAEKTWLQQRHAASKVLVQSPKCQSYGHAARITLIYTIQPCLTEVSLSAVMHACAAPALFTL